MEEAKEKGLFDSPYARNMTMGMARALMNAPKENDAAQAQIYQTQYSPYTGSGIGNPFAIKQTNMFDEALKGYFTGKMEENKDRREKKIWDMLKEKSSVNRAPATTVKAEKIETPIDIRNPEIVADEEVNYVIDRYDNSSADAILDRMSKDMLGTGATSPYAPTKTLNTEYIKSRDFLGNSTPVSPSYNAIEPLRMNNPAVDELKRKRYLAAQSSPYRSVAGQ